MSTAALSGTVTNGLTAGALADVTVAFDPDVLSADLTTDAAGTYSTELPIGTYTISFTADNFETMEIVVSLVADQSVVRDAALMPNAKVIVNAGSNQSSAPGGSVTLAGSVEVLDGSTGLTYSWTQLAGPAAAITGGTTDTAGVTMAAFPDYRAELISHLPVLDRFQVQSINPLALEEGELATFQLAVTTSSGTYTDTVDVVADLPYVVNPGIGNVPVGKPVLLNGADQVDYSWTITAPSGSSASLDDDTIRNPSFTPDVDGTYTLAEANSGASFDVVAGTWMGAISGVGSDGRPDADLCELCHNGVLAPDVFSKWRNTGHAEIFTNNLNTSTHYSDACFACHTVGFRSGGIDSASDYASFMAADMLSNPSPDNWANLVSTFSETAAFANIQCENCHGPNESELHTDGEIGGARVSIAAEVCGQCHGEPLRHARYQQWAESKHADYSLATSRGTSSSCARCHAGQGFLAWLPQLFAGNPGNLTATIDWTAETVHPQTCAVCHDPHDMGTQSGEPNNAQVRVMDNTPMLPSGFAAYGVGRGAVCITCHNTRNGEHNDYTYDGVATLMDDRAPHTAAQSDVLLGENAFFMAPGLRGGHSYIDDTCATCHMELSDPPAEFSYNLSGTNHTFKASLAICSKCHGEFDGGSLTEVVEMKLHDFELAIEGAILGHIQDLVGDGHTVTVDGEDASGTAISTTIDAGNVGTVALTFTESHGRQAMDITVGGTEYMHVRLDSDTEVDASGDGLLQFMPASYPVGQVIAKAGWNFFLIEGDGSHGIHNPDFTLQVIETTLVNLP